MGVGLADTLPLLNRGGGGTGHDSRDIHNRNHDHNRGRLNGPTLGKVPPTTDGCAMLITVGWASLAALFSFSIAMVVWGRHGDNSIKF
jgi:cytochrome b6-f complex subunit 8